MIQFRCWYCNKRYAVADNRIGQQIACTCKNLLCVPKRSGGNCRVKTIVDRLVELVLYGGGGALLGLGLGLLLISRVRGVRLFGEVWTLVAAFTAAGFVAGLLGGE